MGVCGAQEGVVTAAFSMQHSHTKHIDLLSSLTAPQAPWLYLGAAEPSLGPQALSLGYRSHALSSSPRASLIAVGLSH